MWKEIPNLDKELSDEIRMIIEDERKNRVINTDNFYQFYYNKTYRCPGFIYCVVGMLNTPSNDRYLNLYLTTSEEDAINFIRYLCSETEYKWKNHS